MPEYTAAEVAKHNIQKDLWVIINHDVYDLTAFAELHPGGVFPLAEVAGKDATLEFYGLHRADVLENLRFAKLKIGTMAGVAKKVPQAATPYADSTFWRKFSPYYNESHHRLRAFLRAYIQKEFPNVAVDDEKGIRPTPEVMQKLGKDGILAALFGSAAELVRHMGITELPGGVKVGEWDDFHELIFAEEWKRPLCYGWSDGLYGGISIGLPPVFKFGSPDLMKRICPPVMKGEKRICLCITEPYAGSDVSQLKTTAVKTPCGKFWKVRGVKKWITGGIFSDYFTVLCQSKDANGKAGMTMMVAERDDTITTKAIPTSYSAAAGTAYVEFLDTLVPVENQIGKEGMGFLYCMENFNKERWGMIAAGNFMSRRLVEECFKWAIQRQVFGKRLIDQPVIRFKLAQMVAEVESVHSMLEDLTYQYKMMNPKEAGKHLAGPIALLKYKQTRVATLCADNACQIFGGRALTRSGMGMFIEKFQRSYKMQAILGGSEEIMADLAIRQAMKAPKGSVFPKL